MSNRKRGPEYGRIIFESDNFEHINIVWTVLTKNEFFIIGDIPTKKDNIISYILVLSNEGDYLDCEYRVKKDESEIITVDEYKARNNFTADDIPF